MKLIAILLAPLTLGAAITNVTVTGTTATQAVIAYTAPNEAPCVIEVSTAAGYSPLVHDADPGLFTGSQFDNRAGSMVAGRSRTYVAGQPTTRQAADGKYYSRALQADARHYFRITCGADTATGAFKTANIPLGSTRIDPPEPDPNRPGQLRWPTQTSAESGTIIDPQTGILFKRYLKPGSAYAGTTGATATGVPASPAPTGTNWTNPGSVTADDSAYATYSGTSRDWLFMSLNGAYPDDSTYSSNELSYINFFIKGYCSGSDCATGGWTIETCLTRDSVNCEPPIREFNLDTSESTLNLTGSGSLKTPGDWYTHDPIPKEDWKLGDGLVYNTTGNLTKLFFGNAADCNRLYAGEQVKLYRTTDSWSYSPTIQSKACGLTPPEVTTDTSIDLTYNGTTGVPFYYPYGIKGNKHFGLMVRKKSNTAVSTLYLNCASYKAASYRSYAPAASSGGFHKVCSNKPTSNGFYHCATDAAVYGVRPEANGDVTVRFLGTLYYAGDGSKGINGGWFTPCIMTASGDALWDDTDPNVLYCNGSSSQINPDTGTYDYRGIVVRLTYTGGDIECGQPGAGCPAAEPEGPESARWPKLPATIENLTPCNTPCSQSYDDQSLKAQMKRFTSGWTYKYDPAAFAGCSAQAIAGEYAHLTCQADQQDSFAWIAAFDLASRQILAANPTFVRKSSRWCTLHTYQNAGYGSVMTPEFKWEYDYPFQTTTPSAIAACSKIEGTCFACPSVTVDGFTYTGKNWCSTITVSSTWNAGWGSQPSDYATGEPLSGRSTMHWAVPAAVGDIFTQGGEFIKILQKNSASEWVVERGFGADQGWMYPRPHDTGSTWTATCANDTDTTRSQMAAYGCHWYFLEDPSGGDPASYFLTKYVNHALGRPPDVRVRPDYMVSRSSFTDKSAMADLGAETSVALPSSFAGKSAATVYGNGIEKHPSFDQVDAPDREKTWFMDAHPYLASPNNWINDTQVAGDLYKYVIDGGGFTIDYKHIAPFGMSGNLALRDASGPGSVLTGGPSDAYKFCIAHRAGECVAGSVRGEVYYNVPNLEERKCHQGEFYNSWHDICIDNFAAIGSSVAQWMLPPTNQVRLRNGEGMRVLARLYHVYRDAATLNAKPTPDGGWFLGRIPYIGRIPQWPARDTVNRATWVPVRVTLKPPAGVDNAVVEFGYDANFHCSSRAEACVKDADASEPYVYAGDAILGIPCAGGCTISIPAVSGRVLYYRWQYKDASNQVVGTSSTMVITAP